jgi:hypothetical protein
MENILVYGFPSTAIIVSRRFLSLSFFAFVAFSAAFTSFDSAQDIVVFMQ